MFSTIIIVTFSLQCVIVVEEMAHESKLIKKLFHQLIVLNECEQGKENFIKYEFFFFCKFSLYA